MKALLLTLIALSTLTAQAGTSELSSRTVHLNVDISSARLKLSNKGYASYVVKVLVPDLADVTVLNHRNEGEGAPCLATYEATDPQEVIQNNPSTETLPFEIKLLKSAEPNGNGKCTISLIETVNGKVRGFAFTHERRLTVGERELADCR